MVAPEGSCPDDGNAVGDGNAFQVVIRKRVISDGGNAVGNGDGGPKLIPYRIRNYKT